MGLLFFISFHSLFQCDTCISLLNHTFNFWSLGRQVRRLLRAHLDRRSKCNLKRERKQWTRPDQKKTRMHENRCNSVDAFKWNYCLNWRNSNISVRASWSQASLNAQRWEFGKCLWRDVDWGSHNMGVAASPVIYQFTFLAVSYCCCFPTDLSGLEFLAVTLTARAAEHSFAYATLFTGSNRAMLSAEYFIRAAATRIFLFKWELNPQNKNDKEMEEKRNLQQRHKTCCPISIEYLVRPYFESNERMNSWIIRSQRLVVICLFVWRRLVSNTLASPPFLEWDFSSMSLVLNERKWKN